MDFSAHTTLGNVLDFFVKLKNGLVGPVFAFLFLFLGSVSYLASILRSGDLSSERCFSESDAQYERKSSTLNVFFEENRACTKLLLVHASTILSSICESAGLP